ncbi:MULTISPECIES: DUF317 domain-containing protein [unclassified Kitasatospora]|uniref:DUF317 domain-containing protein n=1 Tax=unclassified Kitasatospora TaxID=2633591 RepID=UPI00070D5078|nr:MULTISPECIES: DUF317 domain-containing protein [unclassified Kitasatospora]KQV20962.1 hypothetical protein ASC99_20905 [Kitasatospora sp. Root107]KRB60384.1 hypothetical protein ASE03_12270 [Kitasatospora sp. Root187]
MTDISPAYLAGSEHTNRVFDRLAKHWAWERSTSRELNQQFSWSPDHRFRLADGQLDPGAWWHIAAAKEPLGLPQWQAGFSEDSPPEIVMAVTEELALTGSAIDWTGEAHPALQPPADRRTMIRILRDAGWRCVLRDGLLDLEAPDALARVQVRTDPPGDPFDLMGHPHLYVEVGPRGSGGHPPYWQALLTTAAPTVVVDALARALTDPTPVQRDRDWMNRHLLAHHDLADKHRGAAAVAGPRRRYTKDDVRTAAAEVISDSLLWVSAQALTVRERIADHVVPSHSELRITWKDLSASAQNLAATLVADLVREAAGRTEVLVGLPPQSPRSGAGENRREVPQLGLTTSVFTNEDLCDTAARVCAAQISWIDEPSGLADSMDELVIASTAGQPGQLAWEDVVPAEREHAHREVRRLLDQAGTDAATRALFTLVTPDGRKTATTTTERVAAASARSPLAGRLVVTEAPGPGGPPSAPPSSSAARPPR